MQQPQSKYVETTIGIVSDCVVFTVNLADVTPSNSIGREMSMAVAKSAGIRVPAIGRMMLQLRSAN